VTQIEAFKVGDLVRTSGSDAVLFIHNVKMRRGKTWYHVEELGAPWDDASSTRWAAHNELQPAG
jgi:hypothetical protein